MSNIHSNTDVAAALRSLDLYHKGIFFFFLVHICDSLYIADGAILIAFILFNIKSSVCLKRKCGRKWVAGGVFDNVILTAARVTWSRIPSIDTFAGVGTFNITEGTHNTVS